MLTLPEHCCSNIDLGKIYIKPWQGQITRFNHLPPDDIPLEKCYSHNSLPIIMARSRNSLLHNCP